VAARGGAAGRVTGAWRRLPGERRMAALAAVGLFVAMFLPWYQITARTRNGLDSANVSAFGDFSFVEAAVLLVALGVLVLLFMRAEGRAFHLPGGDGSVILAAGAWTTVLLVWRAFDKPHTDHASALGLQWGFVFAFAASGALAYAGHRVRAAHRAEPPLPGDAPTAPLAGPPPAPPSP
jgi:sulfite exporter TauE/SafE